MRGCFNLKLMESVVLKMDLLFCVVTYRQAQRPGVVLKLALMLTDTREWRGRGAWLTH